MKASWILSLLWARKLIVLICTVTSLLGGLTVMMVAPPRYKASARVTLDYVKPDPMTGISVSNNRQAEQYIRVQLQKVRDYQVALPAAEALGWLDSPDMLAAYAARAGGDRRPFQQWAADQLLSTTTATMVPGSNIMEIQYRGDSPELATAAVEAIRQGFIAADIEERRQSAVMRAEAVAETLGPLRTKIAELEAKQAEYARETGIVLERDGDNPENRTLVNLARSKDIVVTQRTAPYASDAREALNVLEARIAESQRSLGPNNPRLLQLQQQQRLLAAQVAAEQSSTGAAASALAAQAAMRQREFEEQKVKVLGEREKVLQMRLHLDQIARYSAALTKASETLAHLRTLSTSTVSGATALGAPVTEPKPVFPNPSLVLFGSGGLGFLLGSLLALLAELLHRRVRSAHDLELAAGQPVLGLVPYKAIGGGRTQIGESLPVPEDSLPITTIAA
ncbi:Wzz/FepE/Etk N-terminal domain-containing protein [Phenylobacterium kunshanense]|uniref:Polysaccharide chain length determinant N-terminal domain-containing protein n=1 Tax=Phenylobacterium kunshanense TaxID=1445034 RepID=A0A328BIN9_9CAUL|nr:Wzz/FepE/Etk N-terminal domain-containing protein [Phenylobacterium kunshanense]RAK66525.1 hypothetical protein DJ019_09810 [Phenylobacterium kunshanense]